MKQMVVPAAIVSSTLVEVRTFVADRTRREFPDMPEVDVNEPSELVARAGLSLLLTPKASSVSMIPTALARVSAATKVAEFAVRLFLFT